MTSRNLATALTAALAIRPIPEKVPARTPPRNAPPDDDTLLNALRHSATGRDQIMQRRLGALPENAAS